jgi:cysteinyl-tRNA synthetase
MHNNMITINGRKMGKSYNNVIKLTELFAGDHPELSQAYHPMTVRFFILQSHYRSTLDFSNEALQAAEKGLKRLWDAYEGLSSPNWTATTTHSEAGDTEFDANVNRLLNEIPEFVNDDFNTAKALANLFELVSTLNSVKDGVIAITTLSPTTITRLKTEIKIWLEDVFGLMGVTEADNEKLQGVMELLIEIRKEAKSRKDFVTSDKIRDQLVAMGIQLKDEKGGGTSWTIDS